MEKGMHRAVSSLQIRIRPLIFSSWMQ